MRRLQLTATTFALLAIAVTAAADEKLLQPPHSVALAQPGAQNGESQKHDVQKLDKPAQPMQPQDPREAQRGAEQPMEPREGRRGQRGEHRDAEQPQEPREGRRGQRGEHRDAEQPMEPREGRRGQRGEHRDAEQPMPFDQHPSPFAFGAMCLGVGAVLGAAVLAVIRRRKTATTYVAVPAKDVPVTVEV